MPANRIVPADDESAMLETAIDILAKLISFPSVSDVSNRDVVDYISGYLAAHGARVERLRSPRQDKENLWATFGDGNEGGLVLSGHIDVVPVADQVWAKPPFSLTREGGKLYGRGTTDMKGFVACAMACATLVRNRHLRRPIHLAITFDEEIGCFGAKELVDFLRRENIRPAAIFVGEPTSMAVVDRHKGFAGFTTEITGIPAHSSLPHLGLNAIDVAADLVRTLTSIGEAQRSGYRDEAFVYPHPSVNVGVIRGGSVRNVVAASCAFDWETRPILPRHLADVLELFDRHVAEQLDRYRASGSAVPSIVTRLVNETPPLTGHAASDATALALRFARQNTTRAVTYGTEAGIYEAAGYAAMVCGPGDIEQAHVPDEWIEVDQLARCLGFIRRLADYATSA